MNELNQTKNSYNLLQLFPPMLIVLLVYSGRFKIPYISGVLPSFFYIGILFIIILIACSFIYKEVSFHSNSLTFIFLNLVLFTYMTIRSFNNSSMDDNLILIEILGYVVPLILFIFLFIKTKKDNQNIISLIYLLSSFFGILGLLSGELSDGKLSVLGGGANVYGRYMAFGFIISLYYLLVCQKKHIKLVMLVSITTFFILIIATGSRQSFLAVLLTVFLFIIFYTLIGIKTKNIKKKNVVLISVVFLIGSYYISNYAVNTRLWNRLLLLFETDKGTSVSARLIMIEKAKQMFIETPIFGASMGGFKQEMPFYSYPHNIIYEMLAEYGLVGFVIFLMIIIYILIKSISSLKLIKKELNSNIIILLLILFIVSFYFSLISGNLYDSRWIWFYGALLVNHSIILRSGKINETD